MSYKNKEDHCILIEGFKNAYCDSDNLPFDDCKNTIIKGIEKGSDLKTKSKIDPLGGIEDQGDMSFNLLDLDNELAKSLVFQNDNSINIEDPDPIYYDDDEFTVDSTDHPTAQDLKLGKTARIVPPWKLDGSHTIEFYHYFDNNSSIQYYFRKTTQSALFYYNTTSGLTAFIYSNGSTSYSFKPSYVVPILNAWNHIVFRWESGVNLSLFLNGTKILDYNSTYICNPDDTYFFGLLGMGDIDGYYLSGKMAFMKIWKRAISDTEANNLYKGKEISNENLFFSWKPMFDQGRTLIDESGNNRHLSIKNPATNYYESRQILPSDLIYLPKDTVSVQSVDLATKKLTVNRGIYSCLEDKFKAFYQKPLNGITSLDYVIKGYTDHAFNFEGRLIAYYKNKVLQYLGYISNITQEKGKLWKIQTKSVLNLLKEGLKNYNYGVSFRDNLWSVSLWNFQFSNSGNAYTISQSSFLATNFSEIEDQVNGGYTSDPPIYFFFDRGYFNTVSDNTEINSENEITKGALKAVFSDPDFKMIIYENNNNYVMSAKNGITKNCLLVGSVDLETYINENNPSNLIGSYLEFGENKFIKIIGYNSTTGKIKISKTIYDENLKGSSYGTDSIISDDILVLKIAPIFEANNLQELIYGLLTSTGSGNNGNFDQYPGLFSLGLPENIVNTDLLFGDNNHNVVLNGSNSFNLTDDLQSQGLGLIFDEVNGVFKIKQLFIPTIATSKETINESDLEFSQNLSLNYGYFHPISDLTLKGVSYNSLLDSFDPYEISINITNTNIFYGSEKRSKSWNSNIKQIVDQDTFRSRMFKILQWFNNYAPTLLLKIPDLQNKNLFLGDVILLNINNVAGQGKNYKLEDVPALIVEINKDEIRVILNTDNTALNVPWCFSWEIESYSGTTVNLKNSESSYLLELLDPSNEKLQIKTLSNTILNTDMEIDEVISSNQIKLKTAPTYDLSKYIGFLTLKQYNTNSYYNDKYLFSCNTTGLFSNSDKGKILL